MKEKTIEAVYAKNEGEETATRRIRVVPDYDYDPEDSLGGGVAKYNYVIWQDESRFISHLNNHDPDCIKEILDTEGIIFDGSVYWIKGPSDRDGQYYFSFESRKDAKEYGEWARKDMELFLSEGALGFIYEEKCPCCDQWKDKDSLWGIVGYDYNYAMEYLNQHPIAENVPCGEGIENAD